MSLKKTLFIKSDEIMRQYIWENRLGSISGVFMAPYSSSFCQLSRV